jgi:asparagine synthase (glutamine-hydrolysing)
VARAAGAEHVEVDFGADDFWRLLPRIAAAMDDPAADYAVLPTYKLGVAARAAGIKVVLSGEGGDEMFAGYGRYRRAVRARLFGGRPMRSLGALHGFSLLRAEAKDWRAGIATSEAKATTPGRTGLQVAQAVDCADWLPNDLLTKLDRCLMAHGVEGRVPFLDPLLSDFAFRLPDRLKIHRGLGKWLLRKWLETALPAAKPFSRKRGFTVPVGEWIATKGKALGPLVARQPAITELCRPGAVERLFEAVAAHGGGRYGSAAWHLLFYALWHRRHGLDATPVGDVFEVLATRT